MRLSALLLTLIMLPAFLPAQPTTSSGGRGGSPSPPTAPATAPAPPTKTEDLCTLEGQVVNAVTGEPLRRASIVLMRSDPNPGGTGPSISYSTSSGSSG